MLYEVILLSLSLLLLFIWPKCIHIYLVHGTCYMVHLTKSYTYIHIHIYIKNVYSYNYIYICNQEKQNIQTIHSTKWKLHINKYNLCYHNYIIFSDIPMALYRGQSVWRMLGWILELHLVGFSYFAVGFILFSFFLNKELAACYLIFLCKQTLTIIVLLILLRKHLLCSSCVHCNTLKQRETEELKMLRSQVWMSFHAYLDPLHVNLMHWTLGTGMHDKTYEMG